MPTWEFPGNLKVEKMLRRAETFVDLAEKVVTHMPKSKTMRDAVNRVDRDKARVDFIERYSDLYGMYTETEVVYTDARVQSLWGSLPPEDQARFPFDAGVLDWKYYLQDVHCPAVTQSLRELSRKDREKPTVKIRPRDDTVLAVFDMEGTIISSNVVESYVWARFADLPIEEWPAELVSVFGRIPGYLQIDRRDRGDFLRTFFRRYEGASVAGVDALVRGTTWPSSCCRRLRPPGVRRIREHRAAGHRTVMITAAAEPFVRPLAPLFDILIGAELEERDGRYTGFMSAAAAGRGGARRVAEALRDRRDDIDLRHSYAYADSYSDLPLLRAVGNPVAVAPDSALYRHARRRRWPIEEWAMSKGMPKVVPEAGGALMSVSPMSRRSERNADHMTTLALEYFRSALPRYVGARTVGTKVPGLLSGPLAPRCASSASRTPSRRAGRDGWARVKPLLSGICGSDLSTIAGRPASTSRRSCRCRSSPGTRSSASCSTTATTSRPAPGSCWAASCRAPPAAEVRSARTARPATPTSATASRSAT